MDVREDVTGTLRAGVVPAAVALDYHPADGRIGGGEPGKCQTLTSQMGTGGNNVPSAFRTPEEAEKARVKNKAKRDAQGREWKFQRDVSISGPDAEKCEMVTPVLTFDDIETLQGLVRILRKAGGRSPYSYRRAGAHTADHPEPGQHYGSP